MELLLCLLYLLIISVVTFLIGRIFPRSLIKENKFPFKSFKWEKDGTIYNKLKIKKWKTRLPDASIILSKIAPKIIPSKRMENYQIDKAKILIKETCVAESTHFTASILGFGCYYIWKSQCGLFLSILYFFFNIPFILIQRYNRPRLIKVVNKKLS